MKNTYTNLFTKSLITNLMLGLGLAVTLLSTNAAAQDYHRRIVEINFDFTAGSKALPAGKYTIEPSNRTAVQNLMIIRNNATNEQAIVPVIATNRMKLQKNSALSFNRYGNQTFLAQINMGDTKFEVLRSKAERQTEKAFVAQVKAADQTGEVRD
jgi:hypothetical protein